MKASFVSFKRCLFAVAIASAGCVHGAVESESGSVVDETPSLEAPPAAPAAGTFTPLTNAPSFEADVAQVLTDGRVIVQGYSTTNWYALTPDNTGSYINGTWTTLATTAAIKASTGAGYAPLFYASAVLPDGRFFVGGGEYQAGQSEWQKTAGIYDPVKNTWTAVTMPSAWKYFGDGQSLVLPDGRYMVADCCDGGGNAAILNPTTLTWSSDVGTGKGDNNYDEEGWTLLPDGKVLTVDAIDVTANVQQSEMLDPSTLAWSSAGTVPVQLADNDPSRDNGMASEELGAQVLRPDGTVIAFGALGPNAVYNTSTKAWTAAPSFPSGLDCADAPAALEPNGNVLVATSPGLFGTGAVFFEWDGTNMNQITTGPSDAASSSSYQYNMVVLPTGEIMVTSQTEINVYEPKAATSAVTNAIQPVITAVPVLETTNGFTDEELAEIRANEAKPMSAGLDAQADLLPLTNIYTGRTYSVAGTRLNGISLGAAYGDDAQSATNFPLVRFTNQATGHVQYGRTHDGSNYSIAPNTTGTTNVDVPATIEKGLANMQVVANGVASPAILVNVK